MITWSHGDLHGHMVSWSYGHDAEDDDTCQDGDEDADDGDDQAVE